MKIKYKKTTIVRIITVILAIIIIFSANFIVTKGEPYFGSLSKTDAFPAKVNFILSRSWEDPENKGDINVFFDATITGGEKKGQDVIGRQIISTSYVTNHKMVEGGSKIIIRYGDLGKEKAWVFHQYNNISYILMLIIFFILLLFVLGGKKGFYTLLSLVFTFMFLFLFFVPSILYGYNIYICAFITCIFIMAQSLIIVNGISSKTLAAAVGTLGGIFVSGLLFAIMNSLFNLTGIVNEEASFVLTMNPNINLKGIMFASIVISALGASLDVGVSIASSLNEIYNEDYEAGFGKIFKSGMNIGQDIISTMTSTLLLVYVGGALSSTLLLFAYSNSFLELINRESIIFEILQALIGSIGVLVAVPITSAFYSLMLKFKQSKKESTN